MIAVESAGAPGRPENFLTTLGVGVLLLLPVLYSPSLWLHSSSAKFVGVLLLAGGGLGALAGGLQLRDVVLPTAFLVVGAGSVMVNGQPGLSFWGHANWHTGWLFEAALVGAWAIGTTLSDRNRAFLLKGTVVVAVANALVALIQLRIDLPKDLALELVAGRPPGLLGNPIHMGGLCGAALGLVPDLRSAVARSSAAFALGAGVAFSGSRAPTLVVILVLILLVIRHRVAAAPVAALAVAGFVTGSILAASSGAITIRDRVSGPAPDAADAGFEEPAGISVSAPSAVQRPLEGDVRDPGDRLEAWRSAASAVANRPLLGRGPGRFMDATSRHRTQTIGERLPDGYFFDAHNLLVERAVTVGLLGLAVWLAWLSRALRIARGGPAIFAIALLLYGLVQPQSQGWTPLAFAALGAAGAGSLARQTWRGPFTLVPLAAALLLAAQFGVGAWYANQARLDFGVDDARRAHALLPPWPEASRLASLPSLIEAGTGHPRETAAARAALSEAARRAPDSPIGWNDLAGFEYGLGRYDEARAAYRKALERDPWSLIAHEGLAASELRAGDVEAARTIYRTIVSHWPQRIEAQRTLAEIDG